MKVEAKDQGTPPKPPAQAEVHITVLDTDNSPPEMTLDLLPVGNLDPGKFIFQYCVIFDE